MRPGRVRPRLWLLVSIGCLMCWAASVQASWEAYHRAGEAAYDRGDYVKAEEMFLAAVREAKQFGLQDSRLDISLNKLAFLRGQRGQHSTTEVKAPRAVSNRPTVRKGQTSRRGGQRQPSRTTRRRVESAPPPQTLRSARPMERNKNLQEPVLQPERQRLRRRGGLHRAQPTRRVTSTLSPGKQRDSVPRHVVRQKQQPRPQVASHPPAQQQRAAQPVRAGKRRKAFQAPRRQQRHLQRSHTHRHRAAPPQPGRPQRGSARHQKRVHSTRQTLLYVGQSPMVLLSL